MTSPTLRSSKPSWMKSSDELLSLEQINADTSALGCALMRHVESSKCARERLFNDPYSQLFLTEQFLQEYSTLSEEARKRNGWLIWPGALREKYFDDLIAQAISEDARQLVLLGAGYDSRALAFSICCCV